MSPPNIPIIKQICFDWQINGGDLKNKNLSVYIQNQYKHPSGE